mgnify:CR=1 FL=1
MSKFQISRRGLLKSSAVMGAGLAAPTIFTSSAWAAAYTNEPMGSTVTLGFNVPQTGAYADEGADELRAYQLAVAVRVYAPSEFEYSPQGARA